MAGYPPPYPPPPGGPFGPSRQDLKYQRRILRDQARAQRDQYRYQMRAFRRRSILGPVLAIGVGVVFLLVQTGRLRNDRLWEFYGHWWPLLLVAAGVLLLVEWGIDQARPHDPQHPYFRRSVGGGFVTLVVLLAVAGAAASSTHGQNFFGHGLSINSDNIDEFLGNKHESDETLTRPLPPGGALTINNPHGDLTVTGTSTDNQIHIALHKQVYARSDADADAKARELSPQITSVPTGQGTSYAGQLVSITFPTLSGASADVTLTVPAATNLTLTTNHGDLHVDHIKSPLTLTANHGDVDLSAIDGPIAAHINHNGSSFAAHGIRGPVSLQGHADDITLSDIAGPVTLEGEFFGTTHLEHIAGGVKFHTSRTDFQLARLDGEIAISPDADLSADQAVGPVVLSTRNRNINLDRISGDLSVTNRNGSVDLTAAPPHGNVTVQNRNGSVNLTLPDRASFVVTAETSDGDLQNDFALPSQQTDSRKTLNGTVGKGGSLVRINTSQGDVAVKRASIAPLPPAAPPMPPAPAAPIVSINGADGSSVYVGKDGVKILSGADGSSVIVGKDGLKITAGADGSTVYKAKDGTDLTENADGSKIFHGRDGTRYVEAADGSRTYASRDGTHITIDATGAQTASRAGNHTLTDADIRDRLEAARAEVRRTEQQRDTERRTHRPN